MGATCCKDDAPPSVEIHHVEPVVSPSAPPPVELEDPEALAEWLLERLLANAENEVALPVRPHSKRLRSGARGFSVTFLRAFLYFLRRRGAHELQMAELCKQPGLAVSVCRLTASTGLSLIESCVLLAEAEGVDTSALFGVATSFFSYSWTGTQVDHMAAAAERGVSQLEEASTGPRCLWLDMLCASQNLLAVRGARSRPRSTLSLPTISYSPRRTHRAGQVQGRAVCQGLGRVRDAQGGHRLDLRRRAEHDARDHLLPRAAGGRVGRAGPTLAARRPRAAAGWVDALRAGGHHARLCAPPPLPPVP